MDYIRTPSPWGTPPVLPHTPSEPDTLVTTCKAALALMTTGETGGSALFHEWVLPKARALAARPMERPALGNAKAISTYLKRCPADEARMLCELLYPDDASIATAARGKHALLLRKAIAYFAREDALQPTKPWTLRFCEGLALPGVALTHEGSLTLSTALRTFPPGATRALACALCEDLARVGTDSHGSKAVVTLVEHHMHTGLGPHVWRAARETPMARLLSNSYGQEFVTALVRRSPIRACIELAMSPTDEELLQLSDIAPGVMIAVSECCPFFMRADLPTGALVAFQRAAGALRGRSSARGRQRR